MENFNNANSIPWLQKQTENHQKLFNEFKNSFYECLKSSNDNSVYPEGIFKLFSLMGLPELSTLNKKEEAEVKIMECQKTLLEHIQQYEYHFKNDSVALNEVNRLKLFVGYIFQTFFLLKESLKMIDQKEVPHLQMDSPPIHSVDVHNVLKNDEKKDQKKQEKQKKRKKINNESEKSEQIDESRITEEEKIEYLFSKLDLKKVRIFDINDLKDPLSQEVDYSSIEEIKSNIRKNFEKTKAQKMCSLVTQMTNYILNMRHLLICRTIVENDTNTLISALKSQEPTNEQKSFLKKVFTPFFEQKHFKIMYGSPEKIEQIFKEDLLRILPHVNDEVKKIAEIHKATFWAKKNQMD